MTHFEELCTGHSDATVVVHAVLDVEDDRAKFFLTRGPLERMREPAGDTYRFLVGLRVPVDSAAARLAYGAWVAAA